MREIVLTKFSSTRKGQADIAVSGLLREPEQREQGQEQELEPVLDWDESMNLTRPMLILWKRISGAAGNRSASLRT